jgi:hypothetical protein
MIADDPDPYADLKQNRLTPETQAMIERGFVPRRISKRQQHFVQVPWFWVERLPGATGHTYLVGLHLLYLHWKTHGRPVKLPNGMLKIDGVSRQSKWRALRDLEKRGLIVVECQRRKSPIVRLKLSHP